MHTPIKLSRDILTSYEQQTLPTIKRLALQYYTDLLLPNKFNFDFYNANIHKVHEFVKDFLQYIKDPQNIEHLARIKLSLAFANQGFFPLDCDDKTIIMIGYLLLQNYKFSGSIKKPFDIFICISGRRVSPHHVYPMIDLLPIVKNYRVDATYPKNKLNESLFPEKFFRKYHLFNDLN